MLKYARKIHCFEHNSRSSHLWSFIVVLVRFHIISFLRFYFVWISGFLSDFERSVCYTRLVVCCLHCIHTHNTLAFFCCCSINGFICLERSSRFECIIFIQSKLIKTMAGLLVHFQSGNGCQSACDILSKQ